MNWEKATSPDFAAARESCGGVCLLPMGVLEKHGTHLPLGTDGLSAHELCVRAATCESAMVFPEYYFGSIVEARQHPGTVALPFALILELLEAVCDEISRNGFKKIILVNAHGGNTSLLDALSLTMLKKQKDYMVYYRRIAFLMDHPMMESRQKWHGHADEGETSIMMELFPELVRDCGVPGAFGFHHHQLQRLEELGAQLNSLQTTLAEQGAQLEDTQYQIDQKQGEIDQTTADLAEARAVLSDRLRSDYKVGAVTFLDVLLQATDFSDLVSRIHYMDSIAKADAGAWSPQAVFHRAMRFGIVAIYRRMALRAGGQRRP